MSSENEARVPLRQGLFRERGGAFVLLGGRCEACGRVFFPPGPFCLHCADRRVREVELGNRGRLYAYTTCHMPSVHFEPPYAVGWVDLEEGPRIFSPIEGRDLVLGAAMELVIGTLWQEGEKTVIGYRFRPAG